LGEVSPTGIRQFIVGTGGKNNFEHDFSRAVGLEYANGNVHGVA
nr:alkaline phosphatase [Nocardioidaceae bacterium]